MIKKLQVGPPPVLKYPEDDCPPPPPPTNPPGPVVPPPFPPVPPGFNEDTRPPVTPPSSGCGCGGGCSTTPPTPDHGVPPAHPPAVPKRGHPVIISQDINDNDNYSYITAAVNMHKKGSINLLAICVTGEDSGHKGGLLFSVASNNTSIPILINRHPSWSTRVNDVSGRYSALGNYPNDGKLDNQRPDSATTIISLLKASKDRVTYCVGGHLHNFAEALKKDPAVVNSKIAQLVIGTGWPDRTSGRAEMNLSQGTSNITGTSKATKFVFDNFKGKILIATDPTAHWSALPISILGTGNGLQYLVTHGVYDHKTSIDMGDFPSLYYGAFGSKDTGKEVQCCFDLTAWSALKAKAGNCNRYYIENSNNAKIEAYFKTVV